MNRPITIRTVVASLLTFGLFMFLIAILLNNDSVTYGLIKKSPNWSWPTYHGSYNGQHFSQLKQINKDSVKNLSLKWSRKMTDAEFMVNTPIVHNGIMYLSVNNNVYAFSATTGEEIWRWNDFEYERLAKNRGVAFLDDKLFFLTSNCRLIALNRKTGELIWLVNYAIGPGYYSNIAPLAMNGKVILGLSGGDNGARGFVVAFSADNGKELWRFWTAPIEGQQGFGTWGSATPAGASTWLTGTYDPELNILYWTTGSPWPDFDKSGRPGDNLYSNSVIALNPDNGSLVWHYQFMQGDTHGWDATEVPVLIDDKLRKLLVQAHRNGFLYILDRETGEFISGRPFVKKLTWASGLHPGTGKPFIVPGLETPNDDPDQNLCPWLRGATNWMSPSYSPKSELFYVVALEQCRQDGGEFYIKAINISSGELTWERGLGSGYITPGVLSTAGGLIFVGDGFKKFNALDDNTGEVLWSYDTGEDIFASPITYIAKSVQYVAIVSGTKINVFSLNNMRPRL